VKKIQSFSLALLFVFAAAHIKAATAEGIYQHTRHTITSDGFWNELTGDEPDADSYWVEFPHVVFYDKYLFEVPYAPSESIRLAYDQTFFELTPRIGAYAYEPLHYIAYSISVSSPHLSLTDPFIGFAWYIDYGKLDEAPVWFQAASFESELDRVWGEAVLYAGLTEVDPPLYHSLPPDVWGRFRLDRDDFSHGEPLSGTMHGMIVTTQVIPEPTWLVVLALLFGLWFGSRHRVAERSRSA
jgi:hypothetical protein